jgi:hypothetical protein
LIPGLAVDTCCEICLIIWLIPTASCAEAVIHSEGTRDIPVSNNKDNAETPITDRFVLVCTYIYT